MSNLQSLWQIHKMMNDIMVDLETMDNTPSAAIVAIGAVQCNLTTGELGAEYYRVVDLKGQDELGMTLSGDTIYWWLGQNDAAREALLIEGKIPLPYMCKGFKKWLDSLDVHTDHLRMWGNGASFDNAIVRYAFSRCDIEMPIKFWNDRDMRTIVGFYPSSLQAEWRKNNRRKGTHHNALNDAIHQIQYCSDILKELGVKELY